MGKLTLCLASQILEKSVFSRGLAYVNRRRSMGQNDAFAVLVKMKGFYEMAKRSTENNDKKSEQLRIWVTPEEIEKIEKAQEENGCPNRSEFVRDAVKFYIGYLNNNKNINFISPVISSVIKNEIDGAVRNISSMLFKLAVEESLLTEVLAWYANVAPDNIDEIRELCKYKVATTHGNISFEEARKKYY